MLGFIGEDSNKYKYDDLAFFYIIVVLTVAVIVGFYVLRAVALSKMAKNSKNKKINELSYIAWIPFFWVYLATVLAGDIRIFGAKIKNLPLILAIVYTVTEVVIIFYNFVTYLPLAQYFFDGGTVYFNFTSNDIVPNFSDFLVTDKEILIPYSEGFIRFVVVIRDIFSFVELFSSLMLIFVYIALFRKYWPLHSTGASLLSVFGFFPIMIFLARNKQPIDYEAFLRNRYQAMYGNNFSNYQNRQNGYGNSNTNANNDDPFGDFSSSNTSNGSPYGNFGSDNNSEKEDPFDEFNNKN